MEYETDKNDGAWGTAVEEHIIGTENEHINVIKMENENEHIDGIENEHEHIYGNVNEKNENMNKIHDIKQENKSDQKCTRNVFSENGDLADIDHYQCIFDSDLENMTSLNEHDATENRFIRLRGTFHQGDTVRFGTNAGKQCVANSFVAILGSKIKPIAQWDSQYLDSVLVSGNDLYTYIHGRNNLLMVEDLPDKIELYGNLFRIDRKDGINAILGNVDPTFPYGLSIGHCITNCPYRF